MDVKKNRLEEIGKVNPFKTPVGYFDQFPMEVMSRLPECIREEPKTISFWEKVKPWVYMAAMFGGISLMIRVFVGSPVVNKPQSGITISSTSDIEEFYTYYRDQLASDVYRETLFEESSNSSETNY